MRKLLQNKLVVGILAAVAALCVAANFVTLPGLPAHPVAARETLSPPEPPPIEARYHIPGAAFGQLSSQPWRELFPIDPQARDPFAPPVLPNPVTVPQPRRDEPAGPPQLTLQGVSIEAGRALAVISRSIVAEGQSITGYRVDRILPHRVHLSGPLGALVLDLNPPVRAMKSPAAETANADPPAPSKPSGSGFKNP